MNKIGQSQVNDILDSFVSDSSGYQESNLIRARERRDSHIFYFRDWYKIVTKEGARESRGFKIYMNSFSWKRTRFDEYGRVSLRPIKRNKYE